MQLVSICPKGRYNLMYNQPIAMLLSHLAEDEEYVNEAISHPEVYKIVDNSIVELGESVTLDTILNAAEKTHINEIIIEEKYIYEN